jgi:hypothetical protein
MEAERTRAQKLAGYMGLGMMPRTMYDMRSVSCGQYQGVPSTCYTRLNMIMPRTSTHPLPLPCEEKYVFAAAPVDKKGPYAFAIDFLMGGVSAAVSKTAAAPIERVKLLIQNQNEMIKAGRLSEPYTGILNCFSRTVADEGIISLWRGNTANVIRYFPTQVRIMCINLFM